MNTQEFTNAIIKYMEPDGSNARSKFNVGVDDEKIVVKEAGNHFEYGKPSQ